MSEVQKKQDVDKLLRLSESVNRLVDIGEEVMEDGEVGFSDLGQVGPLAKELKEMVELRKHYREMIAEGKDIDPIEAVQIVQALLAKK